MHGFELTSTPYLRAAKLVPSPPQLFLPHADFLRHTSLGHSLSIVNSCISSSTSSGQTTSSPFRIPSRCLTTRSTQFRLGLLVLGHPLRRCLVVLKVRVGAVFCLGYSSQTQTTPMKKAPHPKLEAKNHHQEYHLSVYRRARGETVLVQYPSLRQNHHRIASESEEACLILHFLHLDRPLYLLYRHSQAHSCQYRRPCLRQQHMVTLQRYRLDHRSRPLNRSDIFNGRLQPQFRNIHLDPSQNLILQAQVQRHFTNKFLTLHRVLFRHYHRPSHGSPLCLLPYPRRTGNHIPLLPRIIPIIKQEWQVLTMR